MFVAFLQLKKFRNSGLYAIAKLERARVFMKNQKYFLKTSVKF